MHYHSWCITMVFLLKNRKAMVCWSQIWFVKLFLPHKYLYFTSYCNQDVSEILIWGEIFLLLFSIQNCVHIPVFSLGRTLHSQYTYLTLLFKNNNFYEITLSSDFSLPWLSTALQHLPYSSFRNAELPHFYFSREYRPAFPTSLDKSAFPDRKELSYLMQFSESFLLQQIYLNWPYFNNLWQLFHFKPLLYSHLGNLKKGFSKHSHSHKYESRWGKQLHTPHTHTQMHTGHNQCSYWFNGSEWPKTTAHNLLQIEIYYQSLQFFQIMTTGTRHPNSVLTRVKKLHAQVRRA